MLTPDYMSACADQVEKLYSDLADTITKDIARRILKTGKVTSSAKWQAQQLEECGKLMDDIITDVSQQTGKTEDEIRKLFEDAGTASMKFDAQPLLDAGMKVSTKLSPAMRQVLEANLKVTTNEMRNLSRTTASTGQEFFVDAMDEAVMKVESGAFSYGKALRDAIDKCADYGAVVRYDSGRKISLEAAARMNIMTAINKTTAKITEKNCDDLDAEYVETSAHPGARPTHAVWQGRVFRRGKADEYYECFEDATAYGTAGGLCGINCRHSFYPYFPGISKKAYTQADLDAYSAKDVSYNGVLMTLYEASQKQRAIERSIRKSKRKMSVFEDAIRKCKDADATKALREGYQDARRELSQRRAVLTDFCEQTGLEKDSLRHKIPVPSVLNKNTAAVASGRVKMGDLPSKLGSDHAADMKKIIKDASGRAQNAWNAYADKIKCISSKTPKHAYYSPIDGGIHVNITTDSKGNPSEAPYTVVFHEFGHNIDFLSSNQGYFSTDYKNRKFGDTLRKEIERHIDEHKRTSLTTEEEKTIQNSVNRQIKRGLIGESDREATIQWKRNELLNDRRYAISHLIDDYNEKYDKESLAQLSDMFEATFTKEMPKKFAYPFGWGHGAKYWNNQYTDMQACEAFAEMFSLTFANKKAAGVVAEVFPETYNLFQDMLAEMASKAK